VSRQTSTAAPLAFPLSLSFKILALAPQIAVTDATGQLIAYVKQKLFKLKEEVTVFADREQTRGLYRISADRVLDISARYHIQDASGASIGVLERKGMRSLWRASYDIHRDGRPLLHIAEENPWVKMADGIFGELPIIGILSGFVFHPAYLVTYAGTGAPLLRAVKQPAFFESRYTIERVGTGDPEDERLAVLCLLMMVLLERRRG
jgi:hypothetical protein